MNCLEFRRLKLTDPYVTDTHANEHRDQCATCSAFEREILMLDSELRGALAVEVPEGFAAKVLLNQSLQPERRPTRRYYWLSLAASLFAVAAGYLWLSQPAAQSFEEHMLTHIEHPAAARDLKHDHIQQVLYSVDAETSQLPGKVLYASNCIIDGEMVAHLVVQDDDLQVTLILVPQQSMSGITSLASDGWQGVVHEHPVGSLAAIVKSDVPVQPGLERTARRYGAAIRRRTI
jgi:anti-sigma factor RsiW